MEHQKQLAFIQGLGFGSLIGTLIGVSITTWAFSTANPKEPPQKFEVVDTYNNCEVVRYTPVNSARYHYFLDCANETN